MTNQIFTPIPGLANYQASPCGLILSVRRNKLIAIQTDKVGYKYVKLKWDGRETKSTMMLHRLVAAAFIPNPENKGTVNHKDGNKANNHKDNLEWATMGEQIRHAVATGLIVRPSGPLHHRYGTSNIASPETRAKMSAAKTGKHRVNGKWVD